MADKGQKTEILKEIADAIDGVRYEYEYIWDGNSERREVDVFRTLSNLADDLREKAQEQGG